MPPPSLPKNAWIRIGALLSLGSLIWSVFRSNRRLGRLSAGLAGAFLERWDELRLGRKVSGILAAAEARGVRADDAGLEAAWRRE